MSYDSYKQGPYSRAYSRRPYTPSRKPKSLTNYASARSQILLNIQGQQFHVVVAIVFCFSFFMHISYFYFRKKMRRYDLIDLSTLLAKREKKQETI